MPPIPITLASERAVAMSCATEAVLSSFRPTMQALAPRCTRARTWAEQMLPLPPVQKTTLPEKMPSFQTSETYSDLGRGMVRVVVVAKLWVFGRGLWGGSGRRRARDEAEEDEEVRQREKNGRCFDLLAINGRKGNMEWNSLGYGLRCLVSVARLGRSNRIV